MPPKKKKGKKKKGKKKDDGVLTVDDKYKKTLEEVEALKDHLAVRREVARRAQTAGAEWRSQKEEAEDRLEDYYDNQKAVSAEMTRQYKTMQTELSLRVHQLETELQRTRLQLDDSERELKKTREEKDEACRQKDLEISRLHNNIKHMGDQFLDIFLHNMERLKEQIEGEAAGAWADKASTVQAATKHTLLEFGLRPLHI